MRTCSAVKLDRSIVDRARVIAAHRGLSLSDYLSDTLRPCIDRDEVAMIEEMTRERKKHEGKGPGNHGPGPPNGPAPPNGGPPDPPGPFGGFADGQGLTPSVGRSVGEKKSRRRGGMRKKG